MAAARSARVIRFPAANEPTGGGTDVITRSVQDTGLTASLAEERRVTEDEGPATLARSLVRSNRQQIVPLADLGSQTLLLKEPLYVVLSEAEGVAVAACYDLELMEEGETDFEALGALKAAVVELYEMLAEAPDLPEHLTTKLAFLERLKR